MTEELIIEPASPDSAEAVALIALLDADIHKRLPGLPVHGLRPNEGLDPNLTFYIARLGGQAVGCGGLRYLQPGIGEVKRMFVRPEVRGQGVARKILSRLEERARELGYERVWLETSNQHTEAMALYRACGYTDIPKYGEYLDSPISVCFEKRLNG